MAKKKKQLIGFEKDGVIYQWCDHCEPKDEKFVSVEKHAHPGSTEKTYASFNGIKWAKKNGYNPIYIIRKKKKQWKVKPFALPTS